MSSVSVERVDTKESIPNGHVTESGSTGPGAVPVVKGGGTKLCLPIQSVLHEYHMKHGLRHEDFLRYRGYCSRRLKHVRKALKFTQTSHRAKHFHKRHVSEDNVKDLRYLEILLLTAERSWAHFMQLKDESELEPRRMHHALRKLSHACESAKYLLKICSVEGPKNKVDARTTIEARAYYHYMEGNLAQNKRLWSEALHNFKNASALYEKVKLLMKEDMREPYDVKLAEVQPLINFCAYNLGETTTDQMSPTMTELGLDFDEKLKLMTKSSPGVLSGGAGGEGQEVKVTSFDWLGQTVQVKLPFWNTFLSSIENYRLEINKALNDEAKINFLDSLLDETRQVQAKLKEEAKMQNDKGVVSSKSGGAGANATSNGVSNSNVESSIMFLLGYVTFIKLSSSVHKNILFLYNLVSKESGNKIFGAISKKLKPQTFLKFFETCSEFIGEILALEQVELFGNFENFREGLKKQQKAFSSFSIYELGRCYGAQSEWKNALALFNQSKLVAASINVKDLIVRGMESSLVVRLLKELLDFIDDEIYNAYTNCISNQFAKDLSQPSGADNVGNSEPLDKNLDKWVKLSGTSLKNLKITSMPPDYVPVPAKPLFFDIASNHVTLPQAVDEKVQAANQSKGGLGGYFRGWWGGGSKS